MAQHFFIFLILFCFFTKETFANRTSLIPSSFSLNRSETMTAYPYKGSYFWYNPALFKYSTLKINILGVDAILDHNTQNKIDDRLNQKDIDTLDELSNVLDMNESTISGGRLNILKIYFPYIGLTTFGQALVSTTSVDNGKNLLASIRAGAVMGFALSFKGFSLGHSFYLLKQAQVESSPNSTQLATIKTHYNAGTLTPGNVNLDDYTNVYYGEALGHNVGLHYQFFEDNHSGIGVSVLNLGHTKFGEERSLIKGVVKDLDKKMEDEAAEIGVGLKTPSRLEQMINVGLHLELGQKGDDIFNASLSMDYHDVEGKVITNKMSFAAEIGLHIPTDWAVHFSLPFYEKDNIFYHVGLLNFNLIGGHRVNESYSYGASLGTHWGVNRKLSLLRMDFQVSKTISLDELIVPSSWGYQTNLSFIFLF